MGDNAVKKTLRGPEGLILSLDSEEIFPDDPGSGTPALLSLPFGRGTGTYWCALQEGEVDGIPLTEKQSRWLEAVEYEVTDFLREQSNPTDRS